MAKSFYYPVNELASATLTDGIYNPVIPAFSSSDSLTNEERAIDQSIGSAVTGWATQNEAIKIDLGAAVACDFIAIYFNAAETADMTLYGDSDSGGGNGNSVKAITASFVKGWNVFTFNSVSYQYWFLMQPNADTVDGLCEVIIGNAYDFDVNFDLNNKIGEEFGTDIMTSYGGNEYANKRHDPKTTWNWNWSNISSSMKTSLEGVRDSVQDYKKFIYSEDGTTGPFHYVRMTGLDFTEVAYQRYSTSISLREQLQ